MFPQERDLVSLPRHNVASNTGVGWHRCVLLFCWFLLMAVLCLTFCILADKREREREGERGTAVEECHISVSRKNVYRFASGGGSVHVQMHREPRGPGGAGSLFGWVLCHGRTILPRCNHDTCVIFLSFNTFFLVGPHRSLSTEKYLFLRSFQTEQRNFLISSKNCSVSILLFFQL